MATWSPDIDRALVLAARAHRAQLRKGSDTPYIAHPFAVALLLARAGLPDPVIIAGLLHDVVEDQDVTLAAIEAEFGSAVAELVASVTEQKTEASPDGAPAERPWRLRKEEQLAHLAAAGAHTAALKAADALHNCQSTLRDLEHSGREAWSRFKAGKEDQVWYYERVAALVESRLGAHPLADELKQAVRALASWG